MSEVRECILKKILDLSWKTAEQIRAELKYHIRGDIPKTRKITELMDTLVTQKIAENTIHPTTQERQYRIRSAKTGTHTKTTHSLKLAA